MTFHEVLKWAGEYDDELCVDDPRFKRSVMLIHQDGSIILTGSAFLVREEEWVIVFSESHSYTVYHCEDLISYNQEWLP